jgi:hypothetical protein
MGIGPQRQQRRLDHRLSRGAEADAIAPLSITDPFS